MDNLCTNLASHVVCGFMHWSWMVDLQGLLSAVDHSKLGNQAQGNYRCLIMTAVSYNDATTWRIWHGTLIIWLSGQCHREEIESTVSSINSWMACHVHLENLHWLPIICCLLWFTLRNAGNPVTLNARLRCLIGSRELSWRKMGVVVCVSVALRLHVNNRSFYTYQM